MVESAVQIAQHSLPKMWAIVRFCMEYITASCSLLYIYRKAYCVVKKLIWEESILDTYQRWLPAVPAADTVWWSVRQGHSTVVASPASSSLHALYLWAVDRLLLLDQWLVTRTYYHISRTWPATSDTHTRSLDWQCKHFSGGHTVLFVLSF